jgi:hypothetical protein
MMKNLWGTVSASRKGWPEVPTQVFWRKGMPYNQWTVKLQVFSSQTRKEETFMCDLYYLSLKAVTCPRISGRGKTIPF